MNASANKKCFIAMPVATSPEDAHRYGDPDHWEHVRETVFVPAIEQAGFEPVRPIMEGATMIHGGIIHHLQEVDMVLCDLSGHNPNVFFELGVRTASDLPIALIRDEHTALPFDTSGINTETYRSTLNGWETSSEVERIAAHLASSERTCAGKNPLWQVFGLTIRATEPKDNASGEDAKLDLLIREVASLKAGTPAAVSTPPAKPELGEFRALLTKDAQVPALLHSFLDMAKMLRRDDDGDVSWLWRQGESSTVYVKQSDYDAINVASRRALEDSARQKRIEIAVFPDQV